MPLFSIITVTFNAESTIARTVESVSKQTMRDFEHIIVDGKSTDNTLQIVNTLSDYDGVKVVSERDDGLYDAMNKGISMAHGEYLIFLNSGDKFHSSDTLAVIAKAIKESGNPDVVYGQTDLVDNEGVYVAPRHLTAPESLTIADFAKGMVVCHQAFVVKRSIAPFFSLKYRFSADYEWCIICLMHSKKNVYAGCVLIDYLIEGLTTANRYKSLKERFKIMSSYYGFLPTLWRHIGFIGRFHRNRKELRNARNK